MKTRADSVLLTGYTMKVEGEVRCLLDIREKPGSTQALHSFEAVSSYLLQGELFMSIQSFTIDIPQATLDDLHARLARTRWPDEMEGAGWDSGTNLAYLKELLSYWQHDFDWRVQEAKLNQFAQFRTQITRLGVHFVH